VPNALIQLGRKGFDVHFRGDALDRLDRVCPLLCRDPLDDLRAPAAAPLLAETEILVTGWGSQLVDGALLARLPRLRLIAHLAGTIKHVVAPEVLQAGVLVTSAAAANAGPVAEFTVAAILWHNKRVLDWARLYRAERADLVKRGCAMTGEIGNRDKVIGVVGASRVGRRLIELLRPHRLRVLLCDPFVTPAEARAMGVELTALHPLIAASDVVSLHQPLLPATENSFGAREVALLRDGALLINTARGRIVDHPALIAGLATGRFSALLDVTEPEPLPADSPLWDMPNVMLTPHVAGSMGTEVADMTDLVLDEIARFGRGAPLEHAVAAESWERVA